MVLDNMYEILKSILNTQKIYWFASTSHNSRARLKGQPQTKYERNNNLKKKNKYDKKN